MAATQPILAGTTLAHPTIDGGFSETLSFRGKTIEKADGSQSTDLVQSGAKRTFVLKWHMISASEKADIITAFTAVKDASGAFTAPDGNAYTVTRDGDADLEFEFVRSAGGVFGYDSSLKLREV